MNRGLQLIRMAAGARREDDLDLDPDAAAYITAVETADGQALEAGVKAAINSFVVGCKADEIWTAIKTSCILAGARTLAGALTPLAGSAPTNTSGNFVADDYSRTGGLKGNRADKSLNTNIKANTYGTTNHHLAVYTTAANSVADETAFYAGGVVSFFIGHHVGITSSDHFYRSWRSAGTMGPASSTTGFFGLRRNNSTDFQWRGETTTGTVTSDSDNASTDIYLFARQRDGTGLTNFTDARISFYSAGDSLDLSLLRSRVGTLITGINTALS